MSNNWDRICLIASSPGFYFWRTNKGKATSQCYKNLLFLPYQTQTVVFLLSCFLLFLVRNDRHVFKCQYILFFWPLNSANKDFFPLKKAAVLLKSKLNSISRNVCVQYVGQSPPVSQDMEGGHTNMYENWVINEVASGSLIRTLENQKHLGSQLFSTDDTFILWTSKSPSISTTHKYQHLR